MFKLSKPLCRSLIYSLVLSWIFLSLPQNSFAQNITLKFKDTPLKTILKEIQKQSKYRFVYNDNLVNVNTTVSVEISDQTVNKVLDQILVKNNIEYKIEGKQIVLSSGKGQSQKISEDNSNNSVTGIIRDKYGNPLSGVYLNIRNSNKYAQTDNDGKFLLRSVLAGDVVRISMIGMKETDFIADSRNYYEIELEEDVVQLENVVVTGYQTLSKERTTGSYSIVTSQQLENKLQPSLKSIMEGQTAGVVLTKDGNLEIRGVSTINGVKTPLIVVDGYPLIGNDIGIESVNPDNIENITVLKDAVAASIYGARASNGVIVITTKSAKKGTFNLSYKGIYQITMKPDLSKLNLATTEDYMDAELDIYTQNPNSSYSSYNSYSRISDYTYLLMAKAKGLISTSEADAQIAQLRQNNALDEIEKYLIKPKQSQQHSFSLSSSTETNQLNTALRYNKEYGNLMSNDNSRFIFDISNTWKPKKWISVRAFANVNYSESNATVEQYSSFTSFSSSSRVLPYTNMYDESGNPIAWSPVGQRRIATYQTFPGMKDVTYHPETDLDKAMTISNNLQARLGGDINVTFCDFLSGSIGGSWVKGTSKSQTIYDAESFVMRTAYNDGTDSKNFTTHYIPDGGKIDQSDGEIMSWVFRCQLNYKQNFNGDKHRVNAIIGSEISRDTYEYTYLPTRLGYDPVSATYNNSFSVYNYNKNTNNMKGNMLFGIAPANIGSISYGNNYGVRDNRFVSWYGNASYEYDNKYIVTGSVRLDLTNFFGTDPKYRYKPTWSVGGTYKMAEEQYFSGLKDIFNRFNIRVSYGVNGNISLNYTPYLVLAVGSYSTETSGIAYTVNSYPNNQLRWEKTNIFDAGVDFSMFNNNLNIALDYYNKKSVDLIVSEQLDYTRGTSSLPQNVGGVTNQGLEVTVSGDVISNSAFKWNSQLVASYNNSNVDYYKVTRNYTSSYTTQTQMVEGYPMDGFWGVRFGKLNDKGNVLYLNSKDELVTNDKLAGADCIYQGHAKPVCEMSWTNNFRYKNFEGSFMFVGKFGHKYRKDAFVGSNYNNRHVGERWRQAGDEETTIYPVLNTSAWESFYYPFADVFIGNASFVKLRDLTLGYNLPSNIVKSIGLTNLKVYFQTRNLFYIAAKGVDIDPETAEYDTSGGYGGMINQGYTSLQLRPEFYFGVQINL
jgi:TonB-linked SusC/RagA family outer membrane protein